MPEPPRRRGKRRPVERIAFDPDADIARQAGPRRTGEVRRPLSPNRRRQRTDQVLAAVGLLIVGALVALGGQSLLQGPAPIASGAATSAPTSQATNDTGAIPSDLPAGSIAPVSPVLEARMPTTIDDVTLSVQYAVDATNLSSGPDARALDAAIVGLGKQASDLEIAVANDQSGTLDLAVLGFRVNGLTATDVRKAVLEAWLAAGTPGVTSSTITLAGAQVTRVSYGDSGPDEYVLTIDDSVFVLETTDASLAQAAAAALISPSSAPPSPQASPGA
ncbi:MAG TPA: hypothetical protein VE011_12145 [Candidatus Dormibacteraeota bacterium]|nr:hypothetical protein [Candidatus Dormibacteraeota bacterium]